MATNAELIDRYERGAGLLEEALRGVAPEALDRVPAPGKWTIRQIAIHVADAEIMATGRIRRIAAEPGARILAFDQEKWAANLASGKLPIGPAMAVLKALRQSTTALLRALPAEAWSRTGIHEERGELSLSTLVGLVADHAENHARQIREHRARFAAGA